MPQRELARNCGEIKRQIEPEYRTVSRLALDPQCAMVGLGNPAHNTQAVAIAALAGTETRLKYQFYMLRGNPGTIVLDFDEDL